MIFTLWCAFGLYHLAITLIFAVAFRKCKHGQNANTPEISIIVAARNELENLKKLIPTLLNQDYPNFEIVVALDRCTDESEAFLNDLKNKKVKVVSIPKVPSDWNPKKYALMSAIEISKGEWLAYTDADCQPLSDHWLTSLSQNMYSDTEIIIGVSPYRTNGTFLSAFVRFESFMTAFTYISKMLHGRPYMAVGRNMAIRKAFFLKTGGYHSIRHITGGDDDLFIQRNATTDNTRVALGKDSLMETESETSWIAYWYQKLRHLSVGHHYKTSDQLALGLNHSCHLLFAVGLIFNTTYSFFWPMLLFYLFIKLGSYRFAAGKLGININYILLPLVDILYAVFIPVIALSSKLVKDIKWKN